MQDYVARLDNLPSFNGSEKAEETLKEKALK